MKSVLLILAIVGAANACRVAPRFWCDSEEIALQCKVYDQCMESVWSRGDDSRAPLVNLELYFESLCPDCQQFVSEQLYPTFKKIGNIMNVTLFPYGNAEERKEGDRWVFQCQHGKEECVGNLLETCTIHVLGVNMTEIMPFIYCVESSRHSPIMTAVKTCAEKQGVSMNSILKCYNSKEGNQLEHQMAQRTDALQPQHTYVPWIVLNGVHTEKMNKEATSDLLKLICDTYTGPKPSACTQPEKKRASLNPRVVQMSRQDPAQLSFF